MSISFRCEGCTKTVKAPDEAGGKWGKCPHCGRKCYIPMPADAFDNEDELVLAPIDEKEEEAIKKLRMQTFSLTQNILHETAGDDDEDEDDLEDGIVSERELIRLIVVYLRQMVDGKLDQAEETQKNIIPNAEVAMQILRQMKKTEQPEPELADVAPRVLLGLMKGLNAKLE